MSAETPWTWTWPAPAKVNLMLHVLGRREDGYHELQTLFRIVDLADELRFAPRIDGAVLRVGEAGDLPAEDLTVRAARALKEAAGIRRGVAITLDKRIPVAAGLGGGSSDAATTLVALNELWAAGLSPDELLELARELGADVPVFVAGRNAWAEGIGERLTPVDLPPAWYVIVTPDCPVPTAAVFSDPGLTRSTPPTTIRRVLDGYGANDCEAVVRRRFPAVGECLDWLGQYGESRLSGTGASCFVACPSEDQGRQIVDATPPRWRAWLVRGLTHSPLLDCVARARSIAAGRPESGG